MANDQSNAQTRLLFQKYELDRSDVFASPKQGFQIITRSGIEKIQYKENIQVKFKVVEVNSMFCCIHATATKDNRTIETLSSATKGEFKMVEKKGKNGTYKAKTLVGGNTDSWYVVEIAEKRALSRAVLKVTGLYEHGFFGEDENLEDFKPKAEKSAAKGKQVVEEILNDLP